MSLEQKYDQEQKKLRNQKIELDLIEKKELCALIAVVKRKNEVENKALEITFSTAKQRSKKKKTVKRNTQKNFYVSKEKYRKVESVRNSRKTFCMKEELSSGRVSRRQLGGEYGYGPTRSGNEDMKLSGR